MFVIQLYINLQALSRAPHENAGIMRVHYLILDSLKSAGKQIYLLAKISQKIL